MPLGHPDTLTNSTKTHFYTKFCTCCHSLFCKKDAIKIRIYATCNVSLCKKLGYSFFVTSFVGFKPQRSSRVLSSIYFFQNLVCVISTCTAKHGDASTAFTFTLMQTHYPANKSVRTIVLNL